MQEHEFEDNETPYWVVPTTPQTLTKDEQDAVLECIKKGYWQIPSTMRDAAGTAYKKIENN